MKTIVLGWTNRKFTGPVTVLAGPDIPYVQQLATRKALLSGVSPEPGIEALAICTFEEIERGVLPDVPQSTKPKSKTKSP